MSSPEKKRLKNIEWRQVLMKMKICHSQTSCSDGWSEDHSLVVNGSAHTTDSVTCYIVGAIAMAHTTDSYTGLRYDVDALCLYKTGSCKFISMRAESLLLT